MILPMKEELEWWVAHLSAWNGKTMHASSQTVPNDRASRMGLGGGGGVVCQGGVLGQKESNIDI